MAKESWIAQPQRIYEQFVFSPDRGTTGTFRDDLERSFAGATITYAFPATAAAVSLQAGQTMIPVADATQRAAMAAAIRLWDDLIAPEFKEFGGPFTSNRSSDIEFTYYQSANSVNETAAHVVSYSTRAGNPSVFYAQPTGTVRMSNDYANGVFRQVDVTRIAQGSGYGFQTLVHELGHALGLNHTGLYNGRIENPNSEILFYEDSLLYSTMSYIGPWDAAQRAYVDNDADWIASDGRNHYPQTPMLLDVYAIQRIYGASTTTRTGSTTYGFNTNLAAADQPIYDFTINTHPVLTIFDSGGDADTLDLSGFSTPSRIDLAPGAASDADQMTRNLWIAHDVWIENAAGGGGSDTIAGNLRANTLRGGPGNDRLLGLEGDDTLDGGSGNDTLDGGPGDDTAVFDGAFATYQIAVNEAAASATLTSTVSRATDTTIGVEWFQFGDARLAFAQLKTGDSTAPIVAQTSPARGAADVTVGVDIVFTFSEPVQPGAGSVRLLDGSGTLLRTVGVGDRQVTIAGSTLTLNLDADLSPSTTIQVTLDAGLVRDFAGNAFAGLAAPQALRFTTSAPVDAVAPTLLATEPADNATGVPVTSDFVLRFSEPVQRGGGSIDIVRADGVVAASIPVGDAAQIVVAGSRVTVNPAAVLAAGTDYHLRVSAGAFRDAAGNPFAGISATTAFNFTTARAADDFPADATTSGRVSAGGGAASGLIETAGDVDHFRVDLVAGTRYRFTLDATASGGLADPRLRLLGPGGQVLATDDDSGGGRNAAIVFTASASGTHFLAASDFGSGTGGYTLAATVADLAAPTITSTTPADDAPSVAPGANLVLVFSEPVFAASGSITIVRTGGAVERSIAITDTTQVAISGNTLTVNPLADLQPGTAYHVNIAAGALRDAAGNGFAGLSGSTAFNFTTQPVADDHPGTSATTATLVPDGSPRSGVIETQRDTDLFRIVLEPGRTYSFDLAASASGGLADPYLTLWLEGEERPLKEDDNSGGGGAARITFTAATRGTYFVQANDAALGTGAYVLTARTVTDDFPWSSATSGVVPVGGEARGTIEVVGDLDLFKVTLEAGRPYRFELDRSGGSPLRDPTLMLFGADLRQLAADDNGGPDLNARLAFTPAAGGTFYLGVGDSGTGTGGYTLRAAINADGGAPLLVATSPADNATDVARAGRFELTFSEPVEAGTGAIMLLRADGSTAASVAVGDPLHVAVEGRTVTIDFGVELAASQGYHLNLPRGAIRDRAGNPFEGLAGPTAYNFTTAPDDFSQTRSGAGALAVGATVNGRIEVAGDVDLFALQLVAGSAYVFDLDPAAAAGLADPLLVLYDQNLAVLAVDDDGGSKGGTDSRIAYSPTATGTYYLAASDYGRGSGGYVLSAALRDTAAPTLQGLSPADNATDVAPDARFVFTFSEPVRAGSGGFTIYNASGSKAGNLIAATDTAQVRIAGNVVTLDPDFDLTPGARYFINVSSGAFVDAAGNGFAGLSGNTAYDFAVAASGDDFPSDASTPGTVPLDGSARSATLEVRGDSDLFRVTLQAGTTYVFNLDATSAAGLRLPVLQLYDGSLRRLALDQADAGSKGALAARIVHTATSSGTYYLGASDDDGGTGSYRLSAQSFTDDHGGDTATTSAITIGGAAATGQVQFAGDADWFRVTLTAGNAYTFEMRPGATQGLPNPQLWLMGPGGDRVASGSSGSKLGGTPSLSYVPATGGTYFVAASSTSGTGTGSYEITSRVAVDDFPGSTATPGIVAVDGAASTGTIGFDGDLDVFKVDLVAGRSYQFDLAGSGSAALRDPFLYLYGPDFVLLASDDDGGSGSKSGPARLRFTATTGGTYYLGAADDSGGTGGYTLRAATVVDTTPPRLAFASPADDATSVSRNRDLVLTFDEPVRTGSGTIEIRRADGSLLTSFDVTDGEHVTVSGRSVTIRTGFELTPLQGYHVTLPAGAIRDLAGNAYAGLAGSGAYNFSVAADDYSSLTRTTGTVAPGGSTTGRIEANGDSDLFAVTLTAGLAYVFELSPAAADGLADPYLELYRLEGNVLTRLAADNDSGTPKPAGSKNGGAGARLAFTPAASGGYYLSAQDFASGVGNYVLRASVADTAPPTLVSTSPADNATGVAPGANLVLNFSEPMAAGSGAISLWLADGSLLMAIPADDSAQVRIAGNAVTIDPATDLPGGAAVAVTIAPGALRDLAGNAYAGFGDRTTYNVTVGGFNALPVSANGSGSVAEDGVLEGRLPAASDADGDAFAYALGAPPANGSATVEADGRFRFVPAAHFSGNDRFDFVVTDARGGRATYRMEIAVGDVPDTFTGTAAADVMPGYPGRDTYLGLGGDDRIAGGGGDDTLDGGAGADQIDGGAGNDLALYAGTRSDYLLSRRSDGTVTVADRFGVMDTLTAVESLRFASETVAAASIGYQPDTTAIATEVPFLVYRFFNVRDRAYFYTASAVERDMVIRESTDPAYTPENGLWPYFYQGTTFEAAHSSAGALPVYRFYNRVTGHHFFTVSEAERTLVIRESTDPTFTPENGLWPFNDEGIGFSAYGDPNHPDARPVFRFYSPTLDRHFFTANPDEAAQVRLTGVWNDEGIGYFGELAG